MAKDYRPKVMVSSKSEDDDEDDVERDDEWYYIRGMRNPDSSLPTANVNTSYTEEVEEEPPAIEIISQGWIMFQNWVAANIDKVGEMSLLDQTEAYAEWCAANNVDPDAYT